MKVSALILVPFLFLTLTPNAFAEINNSVKAQSSGGNSSVNVKINNNVNTGSSTSSFSSQNSTRVNISQTGEGTSQVTINGKEWKLEGPGEINVNESSSSRSPNSTQESTSNPQPSDDSESTDESSPPATEEPTLTEIPVSEEETAKTFSEVIRERIEEIKESLQELFSKIADIF